MEKGNFIFLKEDYKEFKQYEIPRICTQTKSIQSEKKHNIQYKLFGCIPLIGIKSNEKKLDFAELRNIDGGFCGVCSA